MSGERIWKKRASAQVCEEDTCRHSLAYPCSVGARLGLVGLICTQTRLDNGHTHTGKKKRATSARVREPYTHIYAVRRVGLETATHDAMGGGGNTMLSVYLCAYIYIHNRSLGSDTRYI